MSISDLVLALDVDKILAGNARILEHLDIVRDVYRSEHVVVAIDKPSETFARPCGQAVVVDEDMVAHDMDGVLHPNWDFWCTPLRAL